MEKGVDTKMKHGNGDVRLLGDEEKDVVKTVTTGEIDWKDKDGASATLLELWPEMNKFQT